MYFWAFIYFMESSRLLIHPISGFHIYLHTKRQIRLPLLVRIWGFRCDIVIWRLVFFSSLDAWELKLRLLIWEFGLECVWGFVFFFFTMLYFHLFTLCLSAVFRGWIQPPGIDTRGRGRKNTDILYFSCRIWAEWMLSILLLLNLCYPATRRQYLYQERGCASIRVCVCVCCRVSVRVSVCLRAALWQRSASWPADFLPSEIASEDYKTNQQTVIAAASVWLDHNPAACHQLFKGREREGRRRKQREMRKVIKRDVRGRRWWRIRQRDSSSSDTSESYLLTQRPDAALPTFVSLLAKSLGKSLFLVSSVMLMFLPLLSKWALWYSWRNHLGVFLFKMEVKFGCVRCNHDHNDLADGLCIKYLQSISVWHHFYGGFFPA